MNKRFIVTAIGSFSADCVIRELKKTGGYVVGCDIYEGIWHAVSKDCDAFYKAPYAVDEGQYVNFLLDVSRKEDIGFIIPLTDLEIDVLNKYRDAFEEENVVLCMQSSNCLKIVRNKYLLCNFFSSDKLINIPNYVSSEELVGDINLSFPLIAKPYNGRSSEGLFRLNKKEDLPPFCNLPNYIIQEMIKGSVYTVDYVRDVEGNDFAVPREELLRTKNGAGTTVRIINNEILKFSVSYIGEKLKILGCVNMEFIYNSYLDKFYLIDINPRFSAGVAFTNLVGYNMIMSHVNCFDCKQILPPVIYKEQIITKRYVEEVLWVEQ